jgi:RES domain-containing protein
MIVYRLASAKYASDLSGKGAEMVGGRWNNKGTPIIYTSESRALCMLEVAVHIPFGYLPKDHSIITLDIPETSMHILSQKDLSPGWNTYPPPAFTKTIGDDFIRNGIFLTLKIPSAMVPDEHNYLLNPNHQDFNRVKILSIEPFVFDSRLFNR